MIHDLMCPLEIIFPSLHYRVENSGSAEMFISKMMMGNI